MIKKMKDYNQEIVDLHDYLKQFYSVHYDRSVIEFNIETILQVHIDLFDLPEKDYKRIGNVWQGCAVVYLTNLADAFDEAYENKSHVKLEKLYYSETYKMFEEIYFPVDKKPEQKHKDFGFQLEGGN